MSRNFSTREEEAVNELYATIKAKFEQDGVIREVHCLLQSKMIDMMKNKNEPNALLQRNRASSLKGDARMKVLHQLIMEYLNWHGFYYTAEMFSMESSCENVPLAPQSLEGIFGNLSDKNLPILLQLIATTYMGNSSSQTF